MCQPYVVDFSTVLLRSSGASNPAARAHRTEVSSFLERICAHLACSQGISIVCVCVVQFANCVSPNHSRLPLSLHLSQYWVADHLHSLYSISPRPLWCIWRLYFSRLREYGEGCHVRRYSQFDLSGPWIFLLFQLTPVYMSGLWFCLLRFSDTPRFGLYANVCLALLTKPVHIFLWPPVPLAVLTSPLDCSGARSCLSGRHSQTPYIL